MTSNTLKTAPTSSQPLVLNKISVAFFAAVHAVALLAPWFFSWSALGIAILLHWLFGSLGICLGYHRLLTHRSLQVPKGIEYALTILGALSLQGSPIFW
ncbi:MAG TPA: acyl-CoA desaturase, partial [Allocoleopsis sp.]